MQCPFKGTKLGDWNPSTRVQGHMIPDSDGEAYDRVYINKMLSDPLPLMPSPTPLWGRMDSSHGIDEYERS